LDLPSEGVADRLARSPWHVDIETSVRLDELSNGHRPANLLEQEREPVPKETTVKPSNS